MVVPSPQSPAAKADQVLPTVGRMVHYHALGSADGKFAAGEARAAVITAVLNAKKGVVSLAILNPTGMYFNEKCERGEKPGQWDWMPFQKDQQARLAPGTQVAKNDKGEAVSAV